MSNETEQLWSDERINDRAHYLADAWFSEGEAQDKLMDDIAEAMADLRESYEQHHTTDLATIQQQQARIVELEHQLISVLDVAIARGEKLHYSDDDYRARYQELTGRIWPEDDDNE